MKTNNSICRTVTLFKEIWDGAFELDDDVTMAAYELFTNVAGDLLRDKHFGLFTVEEYNGTPTDYIVSVFDTEDECQAYVNATGKYDISDLTQEQREKSLKSRSEITFEEFVRLNPLSWNNLGSYTPDPYYNVVDFSPINEG